ncbi:amidase, partial [Rhizobium leguminosarum]
PSFGNHLAGIASELAVSRSVLYTTLIFDRLSGRSRGPFPDPSPIDIGEGAATGSDAPFELGPVQRNDIVSVALQRTRRSLD